MSDITITLDNLSRFNKRLQKALKKQFNQEIKLNIASNLFANALGVDDEYQLKQKLGITTSQTLNHINNIKTSITHDTQQDIYLDKAQSLLTDINSYFAQGKSLLSSFVVYYIDRNVSLHVSAKSKKLVTSDEGFGLYFEDNPIEYFHENLEKLQHSKEDLLFLETICKKYFTEDYDQNIYLGSRFIRLLGINPRQRGGQVTTYYLYKKDPQE